MLDDKLVLYVCFSALSVAGVIGFIGGRDAGLCPFECWQHDRHSGKMMSCNNHINYTIAASVTVGGQKLSAVLICKYEFNVFYKHPWDSVIPYKAAIFQA